jgi:hypothetical protein
MRASAFFEGFRLRKAALVSIFAGLACLSALGAACRGQEPGGFGGVESLGFSTSYSPTSIHILIGDAEQRRIWTLGIEYTHLLRLRRRFRLDYEGSVMPLYQETDPTVTGAEFSLNGTVISTPQTPVRVVHVTSAPLGTAAAGPNMTVPIYAVYGREDTYGAAFTPLGARISALPRWPVRPSLSFDLGFVVSRRDIPVDESDRFNYMLSFGPGLEFFTDRETSFRVEYIYRHMSNAGQGSENPGVDQGVVRLTMSLHHYKQ